MPLTTTQHEAQMCHPALCELLPIRDFLDDVAIRTNGAFVAGYRLSGLSSYFHGDEDRNRNKALLEALLRSLPEQSVRLQVRFEIVEGLGDLLSRYNQAQRNANPIVQALDRVRCEVWRRKSAEGFYLYHLLNGYLIWDPRIHQQVAGSQGMRVFGQGRGWSLCAEECIQRTRSQHEKLVAEFNSLLKGVEASLQATGMSTHRMTDDELFTEMKRALNPVEEDSGSYRRFDRSLNYESARSQIANVNIEEENDETLKMGGILYSWISLKDLPDATFPGILRELMVLDFPLVASSEVTTPDQSKVIRHYKSRLRKMQAAQRDIHGGYRINVDAQVAQDELIRVLQDVISSSLKTCQLSLLIGLRTAQPCHSRKDQEEAQRTLAQRRQRVIHAVARMAGARAMPETLAKKRIFVGSLPGMAERNKREHDCLTLNAADLLPLEIPWQGTPNSPLLLLETPYRQLIPFSMFDSGLGDANLLIMAKTGGGKTFLAQQFLLMAARANPKISIIERGDSYRPLVELMGGRVIEMDLDGAETINPWDLGVGEKTPTKDKVVFLKNLTRHMIGEGPSSDPELVDNLLNEAIVRTYKRVSIRQSNPTPTFSDLRDELAQWRDEERLQRTIDEAHLAAIKLRAWTGEKGVYSRLFDRHTTLRLDNNWLFFNVQGLSDDSRLETAMSMLIANAMAETSSEKLGQPSIIVLDECWFLLDSKVLAPEVVQLFRTARKRFSSVWGISQTPEDFVGTPQQTRLHGPGIIKNATTKIIGQQPGNTTALVDHLHLNEVALNQIKHFSAPHKGQSADVLLVVGEKVETTQTIRMVPTPVDYWVCTTFARERVYRNWFLKKSGQRPLLESYLELAQKFPEGLANLPLLPEELSGAVNDVEAS